MFTYKLFGLFECKDIEITFSQKHI